MMRDYKTYERPCGLGLSSASVVHAGHNTAGLKRLASNQQDLVASAVYVTKLHQAAADSSAAQPRATGHGVLEL